MKEIINSQPFFYILYYMDIYITDFVFQILVNINYLFKYL
jgi:hypothetical protein